VSLRIFEQLALVLKNRVALKLFTVLHIRYIKTLLRLFEQLALALKKQSCPEIFHCIQGFFKENVRYPVWIWRDPIFSDFRAPMIIFSDSRDPI